jgi:hypothetical protein
MAFGAALALWGIMQGKAAMRYLVDVPGLAEKVSDWQERSTIEGILFVYVTLPLLLLAPLPGGEMGGKFLCVFLCVFY